MKMPRNLNKSQELWTFQWCFFILVETFFLCAKKVLKNSIFLRPRRLLYMSWRAMTWVVSVEFFFVLNEKSLFCSLEVGKKIVPRTLNQRLTPGEWALATVLRTVQRDEKNFYEHRVSNFIVLLAVLWKWMEIMSRISVKSVRSVSAREGGKTIFKHNLCFMFRTKHNSSDRRKLVEFRTTHKKVSAESLAALGCVKMRVRSTHEKEWKNKWTDTMDTLLAGRLTLLKVAWPFSLCCYRLGKLVPSVRSSSRQ